MGLRCGIVGLPNVGKSTIFNALTASQIAAENYPFCTVDQNTGVVPVPDTRLARLDSVVQAARVVPTTVEFVDIAGLVRGASTGEGLGNRFLAHIRETHAVVHVVRCFEDPNVAHVEGSVDPVRDVETVETELALADLATVERRLERARRAARGGDKEARAQAALFEGLLGWLSEGRPARGFEVPPAQLPAFRETHLLTAKPVLYVANVDEEALTVANVHAAALETRTGDAAVVRLCGEIEAELAQLAPDERRAFLDELGVKEPGLDRLIGAAYRLLDLVTFFTTTGGKEVRAWTVRRGTRARRAAAEVHSDFERHFVRAEVIDCADFVAAGGEAGAKARGVMRLEGKDYVVRDGDVIHFRVSA